MNPKAPDFKCSNQACNYIVWPPNGQTQQQPAQQYYKPHPIKPQTTPDDRSSNIRWQVAFKLAADKIPFDGDELKYSTAVWRLSAALYAQIEKQPKSTSRGMAGQEIPKPPPPSEEPTQHSEDPDLPF